MAPIAAPEPPKPRVQMALTISANFSDLGLDDPDTKEQFKANFSKSMEATLGGGNKVIVKDVTAGSINVDFEVEASGSDSSALASLNNATNDLKSDLGSGGLSLNIGGATLSAPVQNVTVATVDVTPAVNETYPFKFKLDGEYSFYSNKSSSNYTTLIDDIVNEVAKWGGLTQFIGEYSRIPKERITLSEGSVKVEGVILQRDGDPDFSKSVSAVEVAVNQGRFVADDLKSVPNSFGDPPTTESPATTAETKPSSSDGLSGGAIAGIVIGVILVIVIIIIIIILLLKSGKKENSIDPERSETPTSSSRGAIISDERHHRDHDETQSTLPGTVD